MVVTCLVGFRMYWIHVLTHLIKCHLYNIEYHRLTLTWYSLTFHSLIMFSTIFLHFHLPSFFFIYNSTITGEYEVQLFISIFHIIFISLHSVWNYPWTTVSCSCQFLISHLTLYIIVLYSLYSHNYNPINKWNFSYPCTSLLIYHLQIEHLYIHSQFCSVTTSKVQLPTCLNVACNESSNLLDSGFKLHP